MPYVVSHKEGISFEDGEDHGRIIVSGEDTGNIYSLLEWTIAAGTKLEGTAARSYGMHLHQECEETFLIKSGSLEFVIEKEVVVLSVGDFVRVPRNTKHGYQNVSGKPIEMLVGFYPAGFETLFVKYRTDQCSIPKPGFIEEATSDYSSQFGFSNP